MRFARRVGLAAIAAAFSPCFDGERLLELSAASAGERSEAAVAIAGAAAKTSDRPHDRAPRKVPLRPNAGPEAQREAPALTYDAARRMVNLHVPLVSRKGDFDPRHGTTREHSTGWSILQRAHSERDNRRLFGRPQIQAVEASSWHQAKSMDLLERAVKSTENRYNHAVLGPSPKGETIKPKTRVSFGGLTFVPTEILGVDLDEASIRRAEELGFKRDPLQPESDRIKRLFAPLDIGAIRGKEILSNELPGHRFELNKVYRLYRAAMREDAALKPGVPVPRSGTCPPERCFAREIIQWQDRLSPCAKNLRIGVVDTAADTDHPTFQGRRIHTRDFVPGDRLPAPNWHGTGVLALLAGNPEGSTPGLVPDADFFAAGTFFADENGAMATDTASVVQALDWMLENDVKIVNMSFAGPRDELVKDEIEKLSAKDVVLVAAAGNEGPLAEPAYPAAYPQVIAVTAIGKDRLNYRYANRGDHIDVAAPGVDIWTAVPGGKEGYHSGTSFAAPHVTGILALLPRESLKGNKNEILDSAPVVDLGEPGRDTVYGRGLLVAPSFCTPPSENMASAADLSAAAGERH